MGELRTSMGIRTGPDPSSYGHARLYQSVDGGDSLLDLIAMP